MELNVYRSTQQIGTDSEHSLNEPDVTVKNQRGQYPTSTIMVILLLLLLEILVMLVGTLRIVTFFKR